MIGACVGIWAFNVLDAAISGRTYVRQPDGSVTGPALKRSAFIPDPVWGSPGIPQAGLQLRWTY